MYFLQEKKLQKKRREKGADGVCPTWSAYPPWSLNEPRGQLRIPSRNRTSGASGALTTTSTAYSCKFTRLSVGACDGSRAERTDKCDHLQLFALWSRLMHIESHYLSLAKPPPESIWYDECAISFVSTQSVNYNLYQQSVPRFRGRPKVTFPSPPLQGLAQLCQIWTNSEQLWQRSIQIIREDLSQRDHEPLERLVRLHLVLTTSR